MNAIIFCPNSESLPIKPENESKKAPEGDQTHICHNRIHEAAFLDPRSDELGKAVAPKVLVDSN